jgi:biotin-(acetyl-CoA carboxylase) ligase
MTRTALARELMLPPPYSSVRLREFGDAFAHAVALAPQRGAGTLVYVGRFDVAEFALVLEPTDPLYQARRVFYAGMTALADALAGIAPPETAIHIEWPDALYVNWGLVGGGRLAWPRKVSEDEIPPWLVFGAVIRTASATGIDPGVTPDITALEQEGFAEISSSRVVESFARNFMQTLDAWQDRGFEAVTKSYFERLSRESGQHSEMDDNGDLLIHRATNEPNATNEPKRMPLVAGLARPSWLDIGNKGPS